MQETLRTRRISELIKKELARIIVNEVQDPKVHDVVITDVNVTRDLDLARVFFTSYDKSNIVAIKNGLDRSSAFVRRELMKAVRLKKVPRIEFIIDSAGKDGEKIDALLQLLDKKDDE